MLCYKGHTQDPILVKPLILVSLLSMASLVPGLAEVIPGDLNQIEHLSLEAGLIVAVVVLWRSLDKKDQTLLAMTASVTKALEQGSAQMEQFRSVVEGLKK